jgi:tetratricopeptide (TPR) repeat protein
MAQKRIDSESTKGDHETIEARIPQMLDKWSRGETSLRDLYGYSDDELYGISTQAYTLLMSGKLEPAKVIFEGLIALDPRNDYYYRALGFLYHRLGDADRAVRQFGYAIQVQPKDLISFVNRAEIYMQQKNYAKAEEDLRRVLQLGASDPDQAMVKKANAMMQMVPRPRARLG